MMHIKLKLLSKKLMWHVYLYVKLKYMAEKGQKPFKIAAENVNIFALFWCKKGPVLAPFLASFGLIPLLYPSLRS